MKYILIILLFVSCNATKQAGKHLNKAFKKDANLVARVTRDSFPCTELLKTDTAFVYTDSTVYVECPQDYIITPEAVNDTIIKWSNSTTYKTIKVPVKLPVKTVYINRYFEDSAKIKVIAGQLITANKDVDKYKGKSSRRGNLVMWLIVAVAILTATNVLSIRTLLKRKLPIPLR